LPEARKLQVIDTSVAKKQAPLTQWMKDVSALKVQWNRGCILCSQVK